MGLPCQCPLPTRHMAFPIQCPAMILSVGAEELQKPTPLPTPLRVQEMKAPAGRKECSFLLTTSHVPLLRYIPDLPIS